MGSLGGVCSSSSRKDLGTRLRFLKLDKKLAELEKKLVEHWLRCSANKSSFTFCYVIDIMSWLRLLPLSVTMLVVLAPIIPAWARM